MEVCYNCFQPLSALGPCPNCGYDPAGAEGKYPLSLRPGTILNGRYIVGRVLGQGGFGITYIALDDHTKQRVAIKEYLPTEFAGRTSGSSMVATYSADREENFLFGKEQFLEEAKTLARFIGDEYIVRVFSYFEENGTAYFTMEYVEGLPLDKYMAARGGRLTEEEADELLLPLMEALDTVHSKGIVHRDIAPDNIIITPEHKAKLLDFGAARYSTGEKSKSLDIVIKHGFAPKEQYTRRGRQGPYTDVYAMAATYYYAITGKVPPDAIDRIDEDNLITPSALGVDISSEAEKALGKALEVTYTDRFQSMGAFRNALYAAGEAARRRKEKERLEREAAERARIEKAKKEQEAAEEQARKEKERLERKEAKRAQKEKERLEREAAKKVRKEQKRLAGDAVNVQAEGNEAEVAPLSGGERSDSSKPSTGKKKGHAALWVCLTAVALIAAGFFTVHIWEPATCTEPETCRICGKTRGQAAGHTYLPATCTEPAICEICGETEGWPLGHTYLPATYEKPATCLVCGAQTGQPIPLEPLLSSMGYNTPATGDELAFINCYGAFLSVKDNKDTLCLSRAPCRWVLKQRKNGYYIVLASDKRLIFDLDNAWYTEGNRVHLFAETGYDCQIWNLTAYKDGFIITSAECPEWCVATRREGFILTRTESVTNNDIWFLVKSGGWMEDYVSPAKDPLYKPIS